MSLQHRYRGRSAASIENDDLRVTVLDEGGHIAEMLDKKTGINPLWTPPWTSIEPSEYNEARHHEFGAGTDARLLAGIMGHNLCVDIFGGPSDEEAAAGLTPHGEASIVPWDVEVDGASGSMRARLPLAGLRIERRIDLHARSVRIQESVENMTACDRPIGWTEHVTLGPPFLRKGLTQFRASATRSQVIEHGFGADDYLIAGSAFDWPYAPRIDGGTVDAFFVAFCPATRLAFGYVWSRADFPWLGIWEENHSRRGEPWNAGTLTRGMEFGDRINQARRALDADLRRR